MLTFGIFGGSGDSPASVILQPMVERMQMRSLSLLVWLAMQSSTMFAQSDQAALMGMRLDRIEEQADKIEVTVTGAVFSLSADGSLRCRQRIPLCREVAHFQLPAERQCPQVHKQNDFSCAISMSSADLTLQGDSLIILRAKKEFPLTITGTFQPEYHAEKHGRRMFIDQRGGFGVYPVEKMTSSASDLNRREWTIEYKLQQGAEVWISIFPPRPYNWRRAYRDLIAHEGHHGAYRYPSRELIAATARYCNVMVVHSWFWPGGDRPPWMIPKFVPDDMEQFLRLRNDLREQGMKFLPYFSPVYYAGKDFFGEVRRALDEYKVDGLYYDGGPNDFRKAYEIIRRTRCLLGDDRLLFRHCTSDPLESNRIYCPFIDAYCDFIYRGEAGRGGLELDDFLRWTVSGYNISNAVGYWVYTGSTGKPGYVRQTPPAEHIAAAIRNEVRLPRTEIGYEAGLAWEPGDNHLRDFDRLYYERLASLWRKIEAVLKDKAFLEHPGTPDSFFQQQ